MILDGSRDLMKWTGVRFRKNETETPFSLAANRWDIRIGPLLFYGIDRKIIALIDGLSIPFNS